jgi:inner membrane protein
MDPLSHVVCGAALVNLAQGQRRRPGTAIAAMLGAIAPDVDVLLVPTGWDIYLRAHEIGTHSVLGSLATASAAAALVRASVRSSRYLPLLAGASIGALSHLALDLLCGGRLRVGWPFFDARLSVPLVAMADPWLVAIFSSGALALWIGRRHPRSAAMCTIATTAALLALKSIGLEHALPRGPMVRASITWPIV